MTRRDFVRRADALGQFRVSDPERPELSETDAHHLWKVLRGRTGEEIVVTNGAGLWSFARIGDHGLERISDVALDPPPPDTTIYMAPLKGDRSEWAVAKVTELGISTIVPLLSDRVLLKNKGPVLDKTIAKWRRIADAAAGQCRRTYDLTVAAPVAIADVPSDVAVADFEGQGSLDGVASVAIGPEGGWGPHEWGEERRRLGLGDTVLRGETAAVAAAVLLVHRDGAWSSAGSPHVGNDVKNQ